MPGRRRRPRFAICAPAAAAIVSMACGGDEPTDRLARAVRAGVATQLGVEVTSVSCGTARCDAHVRGGPVVPIALVGDRAIQWTSADVIRTDVVADRVRDELAELGVDRVVDCGPSLVLAPAEGPGRVTCTLTGGGTAWVDVAADGALGFELALEPAAVRARTEGLAPEELARRSLALDTAGAAGVAIEGAASAGDE